MLERFRRYLDFVINIAPHEWPRVMVCWWLKFLYYTAYIVGYTMLISMFVRRIGADQLHVFLVILALLSMVGNLFFLPFIHKTSKSQLIMGMGLFVFLLIILSKTFFSMWPLYSYLSQIVIFAMLFSQIGIFLVLYIEHHFTPLESERTFPVIESAKTIGAIFGGLIVMILAQTIGTPKLAYVWAALSFLLVLVVLGSKYFFWNLPHVSRSVRGVHHSLHYNVYQGVKHIMASRFLKLLAMIVFVQWIAIELIEFQYTHIMGKSFASEDMLTGKLGLLTLVISLLVFVVQVAIASRFMQRFGVISSFLTNGFLFFVGFVSLCISPSLSVGFFAKLLSEMGLGVQENAYHTSFYVLQRRVRISCKSLIEGFVHPMGFVFGTGLIFVLEYFYGENYHTAISVSAVICTIILIALIYRLREHYTSIAKANVFSQDLGTRQDVIEILGERGHDKDSAALLARIAKNTSEPLYVRSSALGALGRLREEYVLPELIDCIQDDNEDVRYEAAIALQNFHNLDEHFDLHAFSRHRILSVLKVRFEEETSRRVRDQIVLIMMRLKDSSFIDFLLDLMRSPDPHARKDAARMIGSFKDSNIAYYLLPLLEDEDPSVRSHAISALWQFKKMRLELMHPLSKLLSPQDPDAFVEGLKLLGRIDAPQEMPLLYQLACGNDEDYRTIAICSLIRRGDMAFSNVFVQQLLSHDGTTSYHAMCVYQELEPRLRFIVEKKLKAAISHEIEAIFKEKGSIIDDLSLNDLYQLRRLYQIARESSQINTIDNYMRERCDKEHSRVRSEGYA